LDYLLTAKGYPLKMIQPLHIKNAHIWDGKTTVQRDLYTTDVVVDKPINGAHVVDLDGYTIFPGLINAHDHLELNHYPRSKFRDKYDNAHQWGEDMNARLNTEPYKSLRAYPLWDKLFIGGLKNLLCGATTVAHHNPPHKELWRKDFPVRVLRKYGWAHSLHFATKKELNSFQNIAFSVPWFIHAAEGTDQVAASEFQQLAQRGFIAPNLVIIHGVGIQWHETRKQASWKIKGLVWCPSTNQYLLGQTADLKSCQEADIVKYFALGSDSRLTAGGDLLDEMRAAIQSKQINAYELTKMVTVEAGLLIQNQPSLLCENMPADFILKFTTDDDVMALCTSHRADLALVVKGGVPQIGDPDVMAKFPHIQTVAATLDGKPKRIHIDLARRIHQNQLREPGLDVDMLPKRGFKIW
jgi:hypothetical protein